MTKYVTLSYLIEVDSQADAEAALDMGYAAISPLGPTSASMSHRD